jgi:hypothetical protein
MVRMLVSLARSEVQGWYRCGHVQFNRYGVFPMIAAYGCPFVVAHSASDLDTFQL